MACDADAAGELDVPGAARALSVPLLAGALAAWVLATGSNVALFQGINRWPAVTGDAPWAYVTVLGEGAAVLALSTLLLGSRPRHVLAAVIAALLATALLHGLKDVVSAPRPVVALAGEDVHVIGERLTRRSFPSGHATTVFATAALAFSLWRGAAARAGVLALAVVVGLSRLAVGAHWPVDVLGGASLGWLCGSAALHLARRVPEVTPRLLGFAALLGVLGAVYVSLPQTLGSPYELVRVPICAAGLLHGLPACVRLLARRRRIGTD